MSQPRALRAAARLTIAAGLLALAGCSAAPPSSTEVGWREYREALRRLEGQGNGLEPGSEAEQQAIDRFRSVLSDHKAPGFRDALGALYADELFFNDTLATLYRGEEVREHLVGGGAALEQATVEFLDLVAGDGDYYFRWELTIRSKRLNRGEALRSMGMTHVRFDAAGRVVLHQDFWDSSGGLFEHTRALGWILRRAKSRV